MGISPFHGDIAAFRAIENGISIIRPTSTGQSVIFDPHGRAVARMDAFDQEVRVISAYVPVNGVDTVFDITGNIFPRICLIAGIIFLIIPVVRWTVKFLR